MVALNLLEEPLIFTSKWTPAWHHNTRDASLNTRLKSFDRPMATEEERRVLETLA